MSWISAGLAKTVIELALVFGDRSPLTCIRLVELWVVYHFPVPVKTNVTGEHQPWWEIRINVLLCQTRSPMLANVWTAGELLCWTRHDNTFSHLLQCESQVTTDLEANTEPYTKILLIFKSKYKQVKYFCISFYGNLLHKHKKHMWQSERRSMTKRSKFECFESFRDNSMTPKSGMGNSRPLGPHSCMFSNTPSSGMF